VPVGLAAISAGSVSRCSNLGFEMGVAFLVFGLECGQVIFG